MATEPSGAKRAPFLQELQLDSHVVVRVRTKDPKIERGTTPYYFSYSFKGESRGLPIKPKDLSRLAVDMNKNLVSGDQTIIALDRGGTALGVAVSMHSDRPLYIAFSYPTPRGGGICWEEPGGGKFLAVPELTRDTRVVLVDDEINTGVTIQNAITAFKQRGIHVDQALLVAEVLGRNGSIARPLLEGMGCRLDSLYRLPEPVLNQETKQYMFKNP